MEEFILLLNNRPTNLLMHPDHGFLPTADEDKKSYSGYSLVGRLKGLTCIMH